MNRKGPIKKLSKTTTSRKPDKHPGGRPSKYKPEYAKMAYRHCLLGSTDKELAELFEVNEDTIHEWKKAYPEFSESVKGGKIDADARVAQALFKRAIGFKYDEITFEKIDAKVVLEATAAGDIKKDQAYKKKVVTKMVVPDTGAISLWLTNRQKEKWRKEIGKDDEGTDFNVHIKRTA